MSTRDALAAKPAPASRADAATSLACAQATDRGSRTGGGIPSPTACACGGGCPRCRAASLQRKPRISQPGDGLEREADEVADRVMRMAEPGPITSASASLSRSCQACDEPADKPVLQRDAAAHGDESLDASTAEGVARQGGAPLPPVLREHFEPRFGRDLSDVRVHTGSAAEQGARAVQARAYTIGHDIVFGAGEFAPHTDGGRRLLAHELTHVVQQGAAAPLSRAQVGPDVRPQLGPIRQVDRQLVQRDEPPDAGTDDPLDAGGPEDKQIECVKRLGGGANRPGGLATAAETEDYNDRCRKETNYTGGNVLMPDRTGETRLANVSEVDLDCATGITFHTGSTSHTYRLTDCELSEGTYDARVSVDDEGVLQFDLGQQADAGVLFKFKYHLDEGQTDPKDLVGGQDRVKIVATSSGKSVQEQLDTASGDRVEARAFGVTTVVDADHQLSSDDDDTITLRAGQVSATVTATSIRFSFANGILVTHHLPVVPDADIVIETIEWNFEKQTLSTVTEQARIVSALSDPGQKVIDRLNKVLTANLPMRMFEKGYNPFADKDLTGNVSERLKKAMVLGADEGSAKKGPKLSDTSVNASVSLKSALELKNGVLAVRAPQGLGVTFRVDGKIPDSLPEAKVRSLELTFAKPGVDVDIDIGNAKITALVVSGATLEAGGHLKLDYVLTTEALEGMGKLALVMTGNAPPSTLEDVEQKRVRALVEAAIAKKVDPLIRDLIRQNRAALPGVDLANLMGVAGESQ